MADDPNVIVAGISKAGATGNSYTWFDGFIPVTEGVYMYNQQGGSGSEAGNIDVSTIIDSKILQVDVPVVDSDSITVRVEGKTAAGDDWAEVYTEVFTKAMAIPQLWPICEYLSFVRVGVLKTGAGSGNLISVSGDFMTLRRAGK